MEKSRRLNLIGMLLLFLATVAWGTSFVILKDTISQVPAFFVISVRFLFASAIFAIVFYKKLKFTNKTVFIKGVIIGICVTLAYLTQTIGLMHTTPGRNAFLTSLYCIMCPFLIWVMFRIKPKAYNVISAVLCIVGIGLVALSGDKGNGNNMLLGDGMTIVGAVFYSLQIIAIDKFQKDGADSMVLLVYELLTVGVLFGVFTLIFELPANGVVAYSINLEQIIKIAYLTVACTLFAQFAQIIGQKFTTPNQSSIILSLEAVFGVMFSVILGDEKLSIPLIIGFAIIFGAIMINELKVQPFKKLKKNSQNFCDENINKQKEEV